MNWHSLKRRMRYQLAIFPFFGRNVYERLNSRLSRQIKIREEKRQGKVRVIKTRMLFPQKNDFLKIKMTFFDSNLSKV